MHPTHYELISVTWAIVIRNVPCSFLVYIKYEKHERQYLTKEIVSSKSRMDPESIKGNDNDIFS